MPNHVINQVTITGPERAIDALILFVLGGELAFDFEKILPMPEPLRDVHIGGDGKVWREVIEGDQKRIVVLSTEEQEDYMRLYGAVHWYAWSVLNWGTKWNAYEVSVVRIGPLRVQYLFHTAWSTPVHVLRVLSEKFPALRFRVKLSGEIDFPYAYCIKNGKVTAD